MPPLCEKRAGSTSEPTSAQTLQEPADLFIDGAPSPLPTLYEDPVAATAEPASAQVLQEPDVSFFGELLSTVSMKESLAASSSSAPQTIPCDTIDISSPSRRVLSSSPQSTIWVRDPCDWYLTFYIRMDCRGSFHTYPDLGGPFQSLPKAEDAIDHYLHDLRRPSMCKDQHEVSPVERLIQESIFWPDGTRKRDSKSQATNNSDGLNRQLVQVILDKYNDDHNLYGDLAHELKHVVHYQLIIEELKWYTHFNFTAETSAADNFGCVTSNLFFAELTSLQGEPNWTVSCCRMINLNENGHCYGCRNNGNVGMKHPDEADAYIGGHLDVCLPFESDDLSDSDDEDRLRYMCKGLDDPLLLEKLFSSNVATAVGDGESLNDTNGGRFTELLPERGGEDVRLAQGVVESL